MAKILIVEDDIDLCGTYQDALEAAGHTVRVISTGTEAVDCLIYRRFVPEVVILDLQLPGNSGIMILGIIRGMPRLHRTKVIIASGHTDAGQWAVTQWGADLFLEKPVPLDLLKRSIDEFISRAAGTKPSILPLRFDSAHARSVGAHPSPAPDGS